MYDMKEQMRQRVKRIINSINDRERAQLVAKGREEGRSDVLKKLQSAQYASGI